MQTLGALGSRNTYAGARCLAHSVQVDNDCGAGQRGGVHHTQAAFLPLATPLLPIFSTRPRLLCLAAACTALWTVAARSMAPGMSLTYTASASASAALCGRGLGRQVVQAVAGQWLWTASCRSAGPATATATAKERGWMSAVAIVHPPYCCTKISRKLDVTVAACEGHATREWQIWL